MIELLGSRIASALHQGAEGRADIESPLPLVSAQPRRRGRVETSNAVSGQVNGGACPGAVFATVAQLCTPTYVDVPMSAVPINSPHLPTHSSL